MKKYLLYGGIALFLLAGVYGMAKMHPTELKNEPATFVWDPIVEVLRAKSDEYNALSASGAALQSEIERLEGKIGEIKVAQAKLAKSAEAYDTILCTDFGVRYERTASGSIGGAIRQGCKPPEKAPGAIAPAAQEFPL